MPLRVRQEVQALLRTPELKPHFHVAAGILKRATGEVLIAERLGGGPFHGMWEFPGGKIDDGETPERAVIRELEEELGVRCHDASPFMHLEHEYDDRAVTITFFMVERWDGEPEGLEGQQLKWVPSASLHDANLLPADAPVIDALQSA